MPETSARHALPLLQAGQAQKELFHNEALTTIDSLLHPAAETSGAISPPTSPAVGQSWLLGASPDGVWDGHPHALAMWTDGGWRFAGAREGMVVWIIDQGLWARHLAGAWTIGELAATALMIGGDQVVGSRQSAIADPAGGGVIDAEVRSAVSAMLSALRAHGLIAA